MNISRLLFIEVAMYSKRVFLILFITSNDLKWHEIRLIIFKESLLKRQII
jgi:hypothetical protein